MYPTHGLFRKEALRAAEHRWFSPVLIVTPPSAIYSLVLALFAVSGLLTAAIVVEIPERIRASGVMLPSQGLLKVRARRSGWVDRLSVSNGAAVKRGQALMWLTDTQSAPGREPENVLRKTSLLSELHLSELSLEQEIAVVDARRRMNSRRLNLMRRQLGAARSEFDIRQNQIVLHDQRLKRVETLAAEGLIAAQSVDDAADAALQLKANSQAARQRLIALQDSLLLLEEELAEDARLPSLLRTKAKIRRETIQREVAATELRSAAVVVAQGVGVVAGLTVRPGSFVQAGQVIMTLQDPADRLEARLYVDADNAAMIKVGQRVELQLQAYPHQLFGTQTAEISSVSAVALSAQDLSLPIPVQGPVLELRARLNSDVIFARGDTWSLPPGTVFSADVVRRRWPLYLWLLRPAIRDAARA